MPTLWHRTWDLSNLETERLPQNERDDIRYLVSSCQLPLLDNPWGFRSPNKTASLFDVQSVLRAELGLVEWDR